MYITWEISADYMPGEGTDLLVNIERLKTRDVNNLALDVDPSGHARQAYQMYKAAFDREPDARGLGYWIAQLDRGATVTEIASGFTGTAEFQSLYGVDNNDERFLGLLYQHVLHREPDEQGFAYWRDELAEGGSRAEVLASFSESNENRAQVADLVSSGIPYQEWLL